MPDFLMIFKKMISVSLGLTDILHVGVKMGQHTRNLSASLLV